MASNHQIEQFLKANTRQCSTLQVGGFRPSGDPLATRFGGAPLGLRGQPWPKYRQPEYMGMPGQAGEPRYSAFVCQLNLTEAPYLPNLLDGIELLAIYCGFDPPDRHGQGGGPIPHAAAVTVRSYPKLGELVLIDVPSDAPRDWPREFEARWREEDDHPCYDDPDLVLPAGLSLASGESKSLLDSLSNRYCSKVGGFFSSVQSAGSWQHENQGLEFQFALQIAEEPKVGLYWVDGGVLGIATAIGPSGQRLWASDIQFL